MSKERSPTGKRKLVLEASLRYHKFCLNFSSVQDSQIVYLFPLAFLSGMLYSNFCII